MKFTDSTWFMNDSKLSRKSYEGKKRNELKKEQMSVYKSIKVHVDEPRNKGRN